jgi:3-phosphoshikimate 1-carboxyvinyltransferase
VPGGVSSQYLSALLLAAPLADTPVRIEVTGGALVSAPYVEMTIQMMREFGVKVEQSNNIYTIEPARYISPGTYFVEGDASSASYFLAAGAILGGPVTVSGVSSGSLQGDVRFAHILQKMGATVTFAEHSITVQRDLSTPLVGADEDCGDIPDAAMTLAMVGLFARGQTAVRNVHNWRVKETERMVAMVTELRKLGATVEEGRDFLVVQGLRPGETLRDGVTIETYDDHRMAMCFALAACGGVSVRISNPECVQKTFPNFFSEFFSLAREHRA